MKKIKRPGIYYFRSVPEFKLSWNDISKDLRHEFPDIRAFNLPTMKSKADISVDDAYSKSGDKPITFLQNKDEVCLITKQTFPERPRMIKPGEFFYEVAPLFKLERIKSVDCIENIYIPQGTIENDYSWYDRGFMELKLVNPRQLNIRPEYKEHLLRIVGKNPGDLVVHTYNYLIHKVKSSGIKLSGEEALDSF